MGQPDAEICERHIADDICQERYVSTRERDYRCIVRMSTLTFGLRLKALLWTQQQRKPSLDLPILSTK